MASEDQPGGLALAGVPSSQDKIVWARATAQSSEAQDNYKDPSSGPQQPHKTLGVAMPAGNLGTETGGAETGGSLGLALSLSRSQNKP